MSDEELERLLPQAVDVRRRQPLHNAGETRQRTS
jgi:hypothetical protein